MRRLGAIAVDSFELHLLLRVPQFVLCAFSLGKRKALQAHFQTAIQHQQTGERAKGDFQQVTRRYANSQGLRGPRFDERHFGQHQVYQPNSEEDAPEQSDRRERYWLIDHAQSQSVPSMG